MYITVNNMNVLKAMQKAGLITFCKDTGKKVGMLFSHKKHTAYYIDEFKGIAGTVFTYNKKNYQVKYFDGCFHPFVVEIK